jgi:hypothetical protein
VSLRAVDLAVGAFFGASNNDDKRECEKAVHKSVEEAVKDRKSLIDAMGKTGKQ